MDTVTSHYLIVNNRGQSVAQSFGGVSSRLPADIVRDFRKAPNRTLVLYFHGGLVDQPSGIKEANWLYDRVFGDPSVYPVFFIWDSGLKTVAKDLGHQSGVLHRIQDFSLADALEAERVASASVSLDEFINQEKAHPDGQPTDISLRTFLKHRHLSSSDQDLMVDEFGGWADRQIKSAQANPIDLKNGGHEAQKWDYKLGPLASQIWARMKQYAQWSCDPGGAAGQLMHELSDAPPARIVLVGHSTGCIYAMDFLRAAQTALPNTKFDVVFMAPAIRVSDFDQDLHLFDPQTGNVRNFRSFALPTDLELNDHVLADIDQIRSIPLIGSKISADLGDLYKGSLLYFVSNACEGEENTPILGLQQFWGRDPSGQVGGVDWVGDVVWSSGKGVPPDVASGAACSAMGHGDFWGDRATNFSLIWLLQSWGGRR